MLGHTYYYNANLKKIVAVFGAVFNDISVAQINAGKMTGVKRVPLAYAPREKYLSRINTDSSDGIAIKLPRMSFEITDISYDATAKLNRLNKTIQYTETGTMVSQGQSAPYNISFELNIISRGQDEALQILEQILPHFNPNYTLSVRGLEGPESITDVPITLGSISFQDTYDGDFETSRRTIIYTLAFQVKTKFAPGPKPAKVIKDVDVFFYNGDTQTLFGEVGVRVRTANQTDEKDDSPPPEIVTVIGQSPDPDTIWY